MADRIVPSFFSRFVLIVVIFTTIGAGFYVGSMFLEPVAVPLPGLQKASVKFDVRSDVSKNPVFLTLQAIGPSQILPGQLGRVNPFAELPPPATATSTSPTSTTVTTPAPETALAPTSTESATGTAPAIETPPPPAT